MVILSLFLLQTVWFDLHQRLTDTDGTASAVSTGASLMHVEYSIHQFCGIFLSWTFFNWLHEICKMLPFVVAFWVVARLSGDNAQHLLACCDAHQHLTYNVWGMQYTLISSRTIIAGLDIHFFFFFNPKHKSHKQPGTLPVQPSKCWVKCCFCGLQKVHSINL